MNHNQKSYQISFSQKMKQTHEFINKIHQGEIEFFKTGFSSVDKVTYGSIWPGSHIIVGARPSIGKSIFMLIMAYRMAKKGKSVRFISYEDPIHMIGIRLKNHVSAVHGDKIQKGKMDEREKEKLENASKYLQSGVLDFDVYDDVYDLNELDSILAKQKVDVVFFDYIQSIYLPVHEKGHGLNRNYELGIISKRIRQMAKRHGFVSILGSQLNREIENRDKKIPTLGDLRDSGEIEQDGDLIVLLHRDDVTNPISDKPSDLKVYLAKNKNGKTGKTSLAYYREYCDIVDWDLAEYSNFDNQSS